MLKAISAFGLSIGMGVLANLVCQTLIGWVAETWFDDRGLMWMISQAGFAALLLVILVYPLLFIFNGAFYIVTLRVMGTLAQTRTRETIWIGGFAVLLAHIVSVLSAFVLPILFDWARAVAFQSGLLAVVLLPLWSGTLGSWGAARFFKRKTS